MLKRVKIISILMCQFFFLFGKKKNLIQFLIIFGRKSDKKGVKKIKNKNKKEFYKLMSFYFIYL